MSASLTEFNRSTRPKQGVRAAFLDHLRRRHPDLSNLDDDELMIRLRVTQPEIAREIDDLSGVPRSASLDKLYERDQGLRSVPRAELARRLSREYPDLIKADPALGVEAMLDQRPLKLQAAAGRSSTEPVTARFGRPESIPSRGSSEPPIAKPVTPEPGAWAKPARFARSLEPSTGGVPVKPELPAKADWGRWIDNLVRGELRRQESPTLEDHLANASRALRSPPIRVAAAGTAAALAFVEAPLRLAVAGGTLLNRFVARNLPDLAHTKPEGEWITRRIADALDNTQQTLLQLTHDPEAGWARNFLERVLPQGAVSMMGFAKGGQFLVERLGFGRVPAVGGLGGIQSAAEMVGDALAKGASDRDVLINGLVGIGLGFTEAVPIAEWLVARGHGFKLVKALAEGSEEAVQEVIQQVGTSLTAQQTYDPSRNILEGVGEQAAAGAILGSVGSALSAVAAERRFKTDPMFRARAFLELFEKVAPEFDRAMSAIGPDAAAFALTPRPIVETTEGRTAEIPGFTTAVPIPELMRSAARPETATPTAEPTTVEPSPTTVEPSPETAAGIAPASQPETSSKPETRPQPSIPAEPAAVPSEPYSVEEIGGKVRDLSPETQSLFASLGVTSDDAVEAAREGVLHKWLDADDPNQLGYFLAGRKAAREGLSLDDVLARVPRPMAVFAANGYLTAARPETSKAGGEGRTESPETLKGALRPVTAGRLTTNYGYRDPDLPPEIVLGGEYAVRGQAVKIPESIPHDSSGKIPVVYAWVPLGKVVPSHDRHGQPDQRYKLVNTRDYSNPEEQSKLNETIQSWDPHLHAVLAPMSAAGPPIVMLHNGLAHVVGGNSRAIAIKALPPVVFAHHNQVENEFAAMYGLPPAPNDGRAYMVVRIMPKVPKAFSDAQLARVLADLLNESPARQQSTLEKALADASKVPLDILPFTARRLAFEDEQQAVQLLRQLISSGLVDRNTRSALLEREAEGVFYVRALIMAAAYGERGSKIFNLAMRRDFALTSWLADAVSEVALRFRLAGEDGHLIADLLGEFVARLLERARTSALNHAFLSTAAQIEPGDWRYSAVVMGLAQVLVNELQYVATGKDSSAKRVDMDASKDGMRVALESLAKELKSLADSQNYPTDLLGHKPTLLETVLSWLKRRVPDVIAQVERLSGKPGGTDIGLYEETAPVTTGTVSILVDSGWGNTLPPIPLRLLLDKFLAQHPDNKPARTMRDDLARREAADQQRLKAAIEGGRNADDVVTEIMRERAGDEGARLVGIHRRVRELLARRERLNREEQQELLLLETALGQTFMQFLDEEAKTESERAKRKHDEEQREVEDKLRRASGYRNEPGVQMNLFEMPRRWEGRRQRYANLLARILFKRPIGELGEAASDAIYQLVDDALQRHQSPIEFHEHGELFPPDTGRNQGAGGPGRTRGPRRRPTTPLSQGAARSIQTVLDFTRLARERPVKPVITPAGRKIITRHANSLPLILPITHGDQYRSLTEHVPNFSRLTPYQQEGALRAMVNWFGGSGHFLLADGTGVGKTAQFLAVAAATAGRTGNPVLIIAPDDRVINDTYTRDAEMLGISLWRYHGAEITPEQKVLVCTYTDVSRGVVDPTRFESVIFDEAHALRNDDQLSVRADIGIQAIENAKRVMLVTATPLDEPWQLWYLAKIINRNPEAALYELGITVEYRTVNGRTHRIYHTDEDYQPSQTEIENWLDRHFQRAAQSGNMIQREFDLSNLHVDHHPLDLDQSKLIEVEQVYVKVMSELVARGVSAGRAKAVALLAARAHLEKFKIRKAYELVLDEIRAGRQVVVYVHRVNEPEAHPAGEASARVLSDTLEQWLGVNSVGRLYGGLSGESGQQYAQEVMDRFRDGSIRVVVATPQSGGVGISLDDVIGDSPRTVLVVTAPFSAQDVVQIAGRISRVTTRSQSRMIFLNSGSRIDGWNLGIVIQKLATLGAVIGPSARQLVPGHQPVPKAAPTKPEPPPDTKQIRMEAMYEAAPDRADAYRPIDWQYWRDLADRGSLAARLFRWAWGGAVSKPFSLIGKKILSPEDLAAWGQLLRNPAFEVGRFVVTDAEGKVVAVFATSAGLPNTVPLFDDDHGLMHLARIINSVNGAKVYHIHNHPSGSVTPSHADQVLSQALLDPKYAPNLASIVSTGNYDLRDLILAAGTVIRAFAGAVVTNHRKASIITKGSKGLEISRVAISGKDLPPEYWQWVNEVIKLSDTEILNGSLPDDLQFRYERWRSSLERPSDRPEDPFRNPLFEARTQDFSNLAGARMALSSLGFAYSPEIRSRIALIGVDADYRARAIFWVHPADFINRERMLRILSEAAVLFGAMQFFAAYDPLRFTPIVTSTARSYAQDGPNGRLLVDSIEWDGRRWSSTTVTAPSPEDLAHFKHLQAISKLPTTLMLREHVAAYQVTPPGGSSAQVYLGGMQHVAPLNMPVMVQLYRSLSGGMPPQIRRNLGFGKVRGQVQGRFSPRSGRIELSADIFADPELARRVLAHEIGHWIDWLPDRDIARGNLWGRLLSLHRYLKETYGQEQVTNSEFREELIALTQWWRPWNRSQSPPAYNKYRESAPELYADFISVLFNAPLEARQRAPKFYEQFWKHLNSKPEVDRALRDIQAELAVSGYEESDKRVLESILKGYETAEQRMVAVARERRELARSMKGWLDELLQELVDPFIPAERLERSKRGKLTPETHIRQIRRPQSIQEATERLAMKEVVNYRMLKRVHERIIRPLTEAGMTTNDLGLYLQLQRIARGDRASLGNPEGLQPEDAVRLLVGMEARLGSPRYLLLQQLANLFHDIVFEVARRAHASGLISTRVWRERILPNREYYATFWVVHHVSDRITPLIRPQVGTFHQVANPFTATLLKLMVMNSTIAWNNAARAHVDFLQTYFPSEIQHLRRPTTNAPGRGVITYMASGRLQHAEVDAYLARAFDRDDGHHALRVVRLLRNGFRYLIYPLIITYNFGYLYMVAPWKDLRRTAGNLPVPFPTLRLLRHYPQAIVDAWRHYYGNDSQIIRDMLDNLALGPPWDVFTRLGDPSMPKAESEFYAELLRRSGVISDTELRGWFQGLRKHFGGIGKVLDAIEAGGLAINDAPKISAYRVLVERGVPRREAARFARRHAGLPHVYRRGLKISTWSALIPFWNVFVQGLRGDAEVALNPRTAASFWWRWASTDGIMAALAGAASAGLLGWLLKELFDGIPEYDKANYTCIPIGIYRRDTDDVEPPTALKLIGIGDANMPYGRKVVYIRIPRHETHRLLSGLVYHFFRMFGPEHDRPGSGNVAVSMLSFGADQVPGINPLLNIGRAWTEYSLGRIPTDPRTGRPILDYYSQQAGGVNSLAPMFHFTLSQMGVENFIRYDPDAKTTFELAISAVPGLNRVIKASDYGYRERQDRLNRQLREQTLKSEHMLRYPTEVRRLLAEYNRITDLAPAARTPQQVIRLNSITYWRNNVFRPLDEQVLNLERIGKSDQAAALRREAARIAADVWNAIESGKPTNP